MDPSVCILLCIICAYYYRYLLYKLTGHDSNTSYMNNERNIIFLISAMMYQWRGLPQGMKGSGADGRSTPQNYVLIRSVCVCFREPRDMS